MPWGRKAEDNSDPRLKQRRGDYRAGGGSGGRRLAADRVGVGICIGLGDGRPLCLLDAFQAADRALMG